MVNQILFQSTHSRGVRRSCLQRIDTTYWVSIHALTRSATGPAEGEDGGNIVSIHALTRSATYGCSHSFCPESSFNPRTHEECDDHKQSLRDIRQVSIHALTRSATLPGVHHHSGHGSFNPRTHEECDCIARQRTLSGKVSIHALTRSATFGRVCHTIFLSCFNPRTHEECDLTVTAEGDGEDVSIHALTRSATSSAAHHRCWHDCFNPRTHEECDGIFEFPASFNFMFQSTHSRGVRRTVVPVIVDIIQVSIHALTRSATSKIMCVLSTG